MMVALASSIFFSRSLICPRAAARSVARRPSSWRRARRRPWSRRASPRPSIRRSPCATRALGVEVVELLLQVGGLLDQHGPSRRPSCGASRPVRPPRSTASVSFLARMSVSFCFLRSRSSASAFLLTGGGEFLRGGVDLRLGGVQRGCVASSSAWADLASSRAMPSLRARSSFSVLTAASWVVSC